jgi:hypothetical protein
MPEPKQLSIPSEDEIKDRLTELALEMNTLRGVLKILRKREETRRKIVPKATRQPEGEMAHAG